MEVEAVLVGYKELLLRYESLSRSLQQQLGFGDGNGNEPSSSGSLASVPAAASRSPGHRSKLDQQQYGFGSLILPTGGGAAGGGDGSMGSGGRRATSAPVAVPGNPSSSAAPGSADASPSGKWSPGGILQRISSQAQRAKRSITPPRDRDGSRAAAAAAAEAGSRSPPTGAGSAGKPGQHPFFSTLFGSSSGSGSSAKVGMQPPQPQQAAGALPLLRQTGEAGAGYSRSGAPSAVAPEVTAGAAADGPTVLGDTLPGSAATAAAGQGGEAVMATDLIQLGSSNSEEAGSLEPAPAEVSEQPQQPAPPPAPELWDDSQQGKLIVPLAAVDDSCAESSQGQAAAASLI